MANELQEAGPSGLTANFVLTFAGQFLNTSTTPPSLENFNPSNAATYLIAATEVTGKGVYTGSVPAGTPLDNYLQLFLNGSAYPPIAARYFPWKGSAEATFLNSSGGGAAGPGADSCTMNIQVAGINIPDASVWISTDPTGATVIAGTLVTDGNGNVVFLLTNGSTYYLWMKKSGLNPILGQLFVAATTNDFTTTNATPPSYFGGQGALRASDFINLIEHALGGAPDSRLNPLMIVNQALSFLVNLHDWKFRKRPPLDVLFQLAGSPTAPDIVAISRTSNVVTVTVGVEPYPIFQVGAGFMVRNVTDASFDGTFTIVSIPTPFSVTYAQTGANATSSGGSIGQFQYEQFIDLPPDFGELLDVCTKNNVITRIIVTGLGEIAWRRGLPIAVPFDGLYRCALSFPGQVDNGSYQSVPRLELWPRPVASNPLGDLTLTYRAKELPLVYNQDDGSDATDSVPEIPPKFERLLVLLCRLFAQGYEEEVVEEDPIVQAEVAMLLESDGRTEMQIGKLKGGAAQQRARQHFQDFLSPGARPLGRA